MSKISRIVAGLIFTCASAFSQADNVVVLNHADSLVGLVINGEQARELIGNVELLHGTTIVQCDRAIQFLARNKAELIGNVIVRDDTLVMTTRHGMYDGTTRSAEGFDGVRLDDGTTTLRAQYGKYIVEEKKAFFRTNVRLEDTSSVLTADELTYYREDQKTFADGNVTIVSEDGITLTGPHFENYKKLRFSVMSKRPKAVQIDRTPEGAPDTLTVIGDVMEMYQDSVPRLIVIDNVVMARRDFSAECMLAKFYLDLDSISLERSPTAWYLAAPRETTQISGDTMFVLIPGRSIKTVDVRGNAIALSQADSSMQARINQMSGETIRMHVEQRALTKIEVEKTATMVYFVFDEAEANGLNITSGDSATIEFADKRIDRIKVVGGVEGKYVPENLVEGNEREYNIAGFSWRRFKGLK